jgi:hypothetical protein
MENKNLNNNEDDKTVFMSSSNNVKNEDLEKTTINMENQNNQPTPDTTQIQNSASPQQGATILKNKKEESNSGKVSGGAFAAGVAAAGVAGTALGATFSEEIKSVIDGEGFGGPESPEAEAAAATTEEKLQNPESQGQFTSVKDDTNHISDTPNHAPSTPDLNSIELSSIDENGNIFTVSLTDVDGDGQADLAQQGVTLVDGTSIVITQPGDQFINSMYGGAENIASADDFNNIGSNTSFANAGDLDQSDFVDSNNLVEAEPMNIGDEVGEASTGDVVENLTTNDDIQELQPVEGEVDITTNEVTSGDSIVDTSSTVEVETGTNYDEIDWASFSDTPASIESSNYGEALANTDFDKLDQGGFEDQNYYDPGNEATEGEFL